MSDPQDPTGEWRADPSQKHELRWWDGATWSDQVSDANGIVTTDPLDVPSSELMPPPPPGYPTAPPTVTAPPMNVYQPPPVTTPNFNLPGGGAWAQPQQIAVTNVSKSPGTAIAALVLGVGAFFFSLIPVFGLTSIPFAIVGLGLGISAWLRANKGFEGKGMAIAGVSACVAALFVSVIYIVAIGDAASDSPRINSEPSDGICNPNNYLADPDC